MKNNKRRNIIILILLLVLGFVLRAYKLNARIVFFFDQAWISQKVYDIVVRHDMKLVGLSTDLPGVFTGPPLFYFLAPIYYFSGFNAVAAAFASVMINLFTGVMLYVFASSLFRNKKIGLLSLLFWMLSYAQLNFAKMIGFFTFVPLWSLLFFWGIALYVFQKKDWGLLLSAAGYALAFQMGPYLIYLGLLYPIYYFVYLPRLNLKIIIKSIFVFLLLSINYYVAELKWNFLGSKSLFAYLAGQGNIGAVTDNAVSYVQKMSETVYYSFFSFNLFFAFLFFIFCSIYLIKTKIFPKEMRFIYIWLFVTLPLFAFKTGAVNSLEINLAILPALTIFFAVTVYAFLRQKKYFFGGASFMVIIVVSNLFLMYKDDFNNTKLYAHQPYYWQDEIKVVDYTYRAAKNAPFSVCSVSAPLFVNTLWSYIYTTYGKPRYGYVPFWAGARQEGTDNQLAYDVAHVPIRFLIIEPHPGITQTARRATLLLEDEISLLEEERMIGGFLVQKRRLAKGAPSLKDNQHLSLQEKEELETYVIAADRRYSCYQTY